MDFHDDGTTFTDTDLLLKEQEETRRVRALEAEQFMRRHEQADEARAIDAEIFERKHTR